MARMFVKGFMLQLSSSQSSFLLMHFEKSKKIDMTHVERNKPGQMCFQKW